MNRKEFYFPQCFIIVGQNPEMSVDIDEVINEYGIEYRVSHFWLANEDLQRTLALVCLSGNLTIIPSYSEDDTEFREFLKDKGNINEILDTLVSCSA